MPGSRRSARDVVDVPLEEIDESPEEVHANSVEIQKLRDLHEQSSLPVKKKRKVQKSRPSPEPSDLIDASILQAAASVLEREKEGRAAAPASSLPEAEAEQVNEWKSSKKVGKFDITFLEDSGAMETLQAYSASKNALEFSQSLTRSSSRIKTSRYLAQKTSKPPSNFSLRAGKQ